MIPAPSLRIARFAALATTLLTILTFVIAILTPPFSGPLCQEGCFQYPYLEIASRFPRDYLWMIPAIFQAASFLFLLICIHELAPPNKRIFTLAGVAFGTLASGTLIVTYFTQLAVIQPSLIHGESDGISLLTQFNSHGLFIALEEIGYFLMSASLALVAPSFVGDARSVRVLRWVLQAGFVLALTCFGYFLAEYGLRREYLFEIAIVTIDWLTLIVAGPLIFKWTVNPSGSAIS